MEKKRPTGVTIFSVIFFAIAVSNIIFPLLKTHWVVYPKIFVTFIFPSLMLLISVGLFMLKKWGRILAILFPFSKIAEQIWNISVFCYWIISGKLQIPSTGFDYYLPRIIMGFVAIIILLIPIYYLTRPKVKEQFK
jgi:hypothetical protein